MTFKTNDYAVKWDGKDSTSIPRKLIEAAISEHGFCLISCRSASEKNLLDVGSILGPFQMHERSDSNGIVDVTNKPDANLSSKTYLGLSSGKFPPHTDAAYLDVVYKESDKYFHLSPPSMLVLQVVTPADEGGETILVDTKEVYRELKNIPELLNAAESQSYIYPRGECRSSRTRLFSKSHTGRLLSRIRHNPYVDPQVTKEFKRIYEDFFCNPLYSIEMKLTKGDILIVDNFRMLHARNAFKMNDSKKFRRLRRIWIADHYHELCRNFEGEVLITSENSPVDPDLIRIPDSKEKIVQDYKWLTSSTNPNCYIRPRLGFNIAN